MANISDEIVDPRRAFWQLDVLPEVEALDGKGHNGGILLDEKVILGEALHMQNEEFRKLGDAEPERGLKDSDKCKVIHNL